MIKSLQEGGGRGSVVRSHTVGGGINYTSKYYPYIADILNVLRFFVADT